MFRPSVVPRFCCVSATHTQQFLVSVLLLYPRREREVGRRGCGEGYLGVVELSTSPCLWFAACCCVVCCVLLPVHTSPSHLSFVLRNTQIVLGSMADNTSSTDAKRGERWWGVAKAIAYELKPFSLPTVEDVSNAGISVRTNVGQIAAEIKRVAPEAVSVVKAFDPLRALGLFAWLCGWALFIWLEFGEFVL